MPRRKPNYGWLYEAAVRFTDPSGGIVAKLADNRVVDLDEFLTAVRNLVEEQRDATDLERRLADVERWIDRRETYEAEQAERG